MKIIQICGVLEGAGMTRYIIELNYGLKQAGYEVKAYECPVSKDGVDKKSGRGRQNLDDIEMLNYSPEQIAEINTADVVLFHSLLPKKTNQEFKDLYYKFITEDVTTKKVFFFNDNGRTTSGFSKFFGGEYLRDYKFLNSFDKIASHCQYNAYYRALTNTLGKELIDKKWVHMRLPYKFDSSIKQTWESLSEKHKRIMYMGRWHTIKYPQQMLEMHKVMHDDFEFEMRGIERLIGIVYIPDLFYKIDPTKQGKDSIIGPSEITELITPKWKKERGLDVDDLLIDYPRDGKLFVFGSYKREDGIKAVRHAAFGSDFFYLYPGERYGDNMEYAIFEIIENGTVALLDKYTCDFIHAYDETGRTDKTLSDYDIAVTLAHDLSNMDEVQNKMNYLYSHPEEYDAMRNRAFDVLQKHCDPKTIAEKFINDIMK